VADYSPYVPGYMAARSVWDQGIVPLAGKAQDYFKGLAEIFPTVGEYVSESILRSGPKGTPTTSDLLLGIGKMGLDARSVAGEMGEYAKENPIEMGLSMAPWSGPAIGVMDAENLMAQARAAEEAGDEEKASNLRQLATFSLLGSVPGVPRIVKKGGGDEALDSLDRANRNRAQRIEETGEGFVPSKDAPLPEGRRGDPYDPELDVLERQKRIEEATGAAPIETIACGDCYRWAYREVAKDPNLTLVHGTATDFDGKPFAHAWVESGDRVMDWQTMEQGMSKFGKEGGWPKDVFYDFYKPKNIQRYTSDQAVRIGPRNKHFGPWAKGGIVTL